MKKILRYCGLIVLGLLIPIIIITSVIRYYDIGIADIVTYSENFLTRVIHLWDIQQDVGLSSETNNEKSIYNNHLSKKMAHLYFADLSDRYLKVEDRVVPHPKNPTQFAQILLTALFDGPKGNFNQVLPKGDFLRAVYIDNENLMAYVDLKQTILSHFPGGVTQELLTVYAIVNTLTLNMREIEQVKIIIGGQESNTLAGHLDIRYPFTTNMLMVR
ncbi:Lipoprotein LpqB, GerMN domain protein [Candidatus Magnetomorum sp. HK-1]|nr:Lipoprotein LpqB, GerMN domain protein [Candidatus Magnetomorum sp. HK-1]